MQVHIYKVQHTSWDKININWSHCKRTKEIGNYFSGCSSGVSDKKLPQEIPFWVGVFSVLQNISDLTIYYP